MRIERLSFGLVFLIEKASLLKWLKLSLFKFTVKDSFLAGLKLKFIFAGSLVMNKAVSEGRFFLLEEKETNVVPAPISKIKPIMKRLL
jgi:hypothetical protein